MKLSETLILSAAVGSLALWVLEFRRTSFLDSYWLLMGVTAFLFTFLYVRQRRILRQKDAPVTAKPKVVKPVASLAKPRKKK